MKIYLTLLILLLSAYHALAACTWDGNTGTVVSPFDHADVQACVDDASSKTGEVKINIPACAVTWDTAVAIDMASGFADVTSLSILGAGDTSEITNAGWSVVSKTNKKIRFGYFKFSGTGTISDNFIRLTGDTKPSLGGGFRLDHIHWNGGHAFSIYAGDAYGVIDSCTGGTNGQFSNIIWGTDHYLGGGNISWSTASSVGGQDVVIFENNTLVQTDTEKKWMLCDGVNGARIVVRHNTLTDYYLGGHDASSVDRGIFSYEGYNNIFVANYSNSNSCISPRGGSGAFFNNDMVATESDPFYLLAANGIELTSYRSPTSIGSVPPWDTDCDSIAEKGCINGNVFLSKTCTTDADCEGVVGSCAQLDGNIDGTGYPCRDQFGRSTDQEIAPVLFWNNRLSKAGGAYAQVYPSVADKYADHIKNDRDYCDHTTCSGSSCAYTCGSTSVSYSSYTCPHPLTGLTGSCNSAVAGTTGYNVSTSGKQTLSNGAFGGGAMR